MVSTSSTPLLHSSFEGSKQCVTVGTGMFDIPETNNDCIKFRQNFRFSDYKFNQMQP